ncbi:SEN1 N terminal-domain-containing protein [Apiospora sp. TS-2023a]
MDDVRVHFFIRPGGPEHPDSREEDNGYWKGEIRSLNAPQLIRDIVNVTGQQWLQLRVYRASSDSRARAHMHSRRVPTERTITSNTQSVDIWLGLGNVSSNVEELFSASRYMLGLQGVRVYDEDDERAEIDMPAPERPVRNKEYIPDAAARANMDSILTGHGMEDVGVTNWLEGQGYKDKDQSHLVGTARTHCSARLTEKRLFPILPKVVEYYLIMQSVINNILLNNQWYPWDNRHWIMVHVQHMTSRAYDLIDYLRKCKRFAPLDHTHQRNVEAANDLRQDPRIDHVLYLINQRMAHANWDTDQRNCRGLHKLFTTLGDMIVRRANIVVVTTDSARSGVVEHVVKTCHVSVVDEAFQANLGGLSKVWCGQKLIITGDPKQLPPTVISKGVMVYMGNGTKVPVNKLAHWHWAGESILGYFAYRLQWPVHILEDQYRMKPGLYDWVMKRYYGGLLMRNMTGGISDKIRQFDLEQSQNPEGKIYPFFLHCPGKVDKVGMTESKRNEEQMETTLELLSLLCRLDIKPSDIAIVTPY